MVTGKGCLCQLYLVNGRATAIEQVECPVADCADLSVCNLLQGIGNGFVDVCILSALWIT